MKSFGTVVLFVSGLFLVSPLEAEEGSSRTGPSQRELEAQLVSLSRSSLLDVEAKGALEQARGALRRSEAAMEAGAQAEGERLRLLAWAALHLADRRVARMQELEALREAELRLQEAKTRSQHARKRLNGAMARRARAYEEKSKP